MKRRPIIKGAPYGREGEEDFVDRSLEEEGCHPIDIDLYPSPWKEPWGFLGKCLAALKKKSPCSPGDLDKISQLCSEAACAPPQKLNIWFNFVRGALWGSGLYAVAVCPCEEARKECPDCHGDGFILMGLKRRKK